MPATLKDVARLGGVSVATACQALNGGPVNEKTRQRVVQAARKLGYRPNALGRSLQGKKAQAVGLLLPLGSAGLVEAVVPRFQRSGYQVLVELFDPGEVGQLRRACDALLSYRVAGLLLHLPGGAEASLAEDLQGEGVLTVSLETPLPGGLACVRCDCRRAGLLAGLHLGSLGRGPVAALGRSTGGQRQEQLLEGLAHGLCMAGCSGEVDTVDASEALRSIDTAAGQACRAGCGGAVFAVDETLAAAVLRSARAEGLEVPGDLALLAGRQGGAAEGLGPGPWMLPRLSVVRRCATESALRAADLLMERLCRSDEPGASGEGLICIQPELTVRESCGGRPGVYRLGPDGAMQRLGVESAAE